MKTTDARKLNQQTQFELRRQVVRLKEKGKNNTEISKIVGLSQSHISTVWQKYQRGGLDAIKPGVRGRRHGEQRRLTAEQEAGIQKLHFDGNGSRLSRHGICGDGYSEDRGRPSGRPRSF